MKKKAGKGLALLHFCKLDIKVLGIIQRLYYYRLFSHHKNIKVKSAKVQKLS